MQQTEHREFAAADEVREFPNGQAEIVKVGGGEVGRLTFRPGWRWSRDVKPIAGTDSCLAPHFQYHLSGRLAIRMDDGHEILAGPGDVTSLPSGHDAWVVGDDPVVTVDWFGASNYAVAGSTSTVGPLEVVESFGAAWAAHDLEGALALVTEDCLFDATGPAPDGVSRRGPDAIRAAWQAIFDDRSATFEAEETFAAGDRVVQRWCYLWDGGHVRGVDVFRVRDGLVAEKLSYVKG
jgi:ketosteroid isomerase-like protein